MHVLFQALDERVENLLEVHGRVVFERQNMTDERKRCLEVRTLVQHYFIPLLYDDCIR